MLDFIFRKDFLSFSWLDSSVKIHVHHECIQIGTDKLYYCRIQFFPSQGSHAIENVNWMEYEISEVSSSAEVFWGENCFLS